jgi:hypothetical protein
LTVTDLTPRVVDGVEPGDRMEAMVSRESFEVYEKAFPAGTVTLGPEADPAGLGAMYPVAVL